MGSSKPLGDKPAAAPLSGGRCPICSAPTELAFRPFCSRRCADVDLSRWLRGAYAIAGRADVDEDGDDTVAASAAQKRSREGDDDEQR
jgi:endogenous inhibitor of DNA gyrase (YacG/DUF329 family)